VYKFEGRFYVKTSWIAGSPVAPLFQFNFATVTGTNAVNTIQYEYVLASNTTSFATATAPTTLWSTTATPALNLGASISSGSRYNLLYVTGFVRVSGTGTATFAPAVTVGTGNSGNKTETQNGSWFSVTPMAVYSALGDISIGNWT
jgi:hypothetical protein